MASVPPTISTASAMPKGLKFKLGLMMFLQFFIWGAWFEIGFDYIPKLGFDSNWQTPLIFGAFNIGALVALFFSTQFADRVFAAEKFLSFSHLIGGLAIMGLFFIKPAEAKGMFWPFFLLMLVYSVFYVPTISITNSIAFANLRDPAREFGLVRVWGTIGWIAASWPFIFILVDWAKVPPVGTGGYANWFATALGTSLKGDAATNMQRYVFLVAGIASLALSAFSLFLPHTPPKPASSGSDSLAWLKAMKLLKNPYVAVLFLVTFIDAAVHQSFFYWTPTFLGPKGVVNIPENWVLPVMKIGPIVEILTMLILGYALKTLGWRMTMVFGVLGHAARFAVFVYFPQEVPVILVMALHGICYAFFFATVYIFVDEFFPKDVRSSAQGLFNVLILGVGPFAANFLCGRLGTQNTIINSNLNDAMALLVGGAGPSLIDTSKLNYAILYQYSMGAALTGAIILFVFFHPPKKKAPELSFSQTEEEAPPVA